MSNMVPCLNPQVCGVKNHLEGTQDAKCMSAKPSGASSAGSRGVSAQSVPLAQGGKPMSVEDRAIDTEARAILEGLGDGEKEIARMTESILDQANENPSDTNDPLKNVQYGSPKDSATLSHKDKVYLRVNEINFDRAKERVQNLDDTELESALAARRK